MAKQPRLAHKVSQEHQAVIQLASQHDKGKEPYYTLSNGKRYFEDGSRTRGNPVVVVTTHFIIRLFTRDNKTDSSCSRTAMDATNKLKR